jgi:hypothetical protein
MAWISFSTIDWQRTKRSSSIVQDFPSFGRDGGCQAEREIDSRATPWAFPMSLARFSLRPKDETSMTIRVEHNLSASRTFG